MHLDVPYVRQPRDSVWCGAASATMILKYYGVNINQKKVAEELSIFNTGVSVGPLGQYFLRKGFDATIQFWLQGLEPKTRGFQGGLQNSFVIKALKRGISQHNHFHTQEFCKQMLVFVKHGGNVYLQPPLMRDIEKEILQKHPIILEIDSNFLDSVLRTQNGHYIVITGISNLWDDDSQVSWPGLTVHDPDINADMFYFFDELLYSCHIRHGNALIVKPRK